MTECNRKNRLLGKSIRKIRMRRNMTQRELANAIDGISESALRSYELGERCPKQNTLERIAEALDVAPACFDAYGIEHYHELMHVLFLLEDRFGIEPCGKHPIYRRSNPVMRLRMAGLEGVLGEGENHKRGIRRQKRRFHQIRRRLNRDGN